jgi:hypothetical protein
MHRVTVGIGLVFTALSQGRKAKSPGKVETAVMTKAKHLIFVRDKDTHNSTPSTEKSVTVPCHGLDGQNTGVPFADRMNFNRERPMSNPLALWPRVRIADL